MARTVIVASSAGRAQKIDDFSGSTWGQLKRHEKVIPLLSGDLEAIVNPGNVTLRGDDSVLPDGDFKVFLIPTKNKAGGEDYSDMAQAIADAIEKGASKSSEEDVKRLKERLLEEIADHFEVDVDDITDEANDDDDDDYDDCDDCDDDIEMARNLANS